MNSKVRDVFGYRPFEPKLCVTFSVFPTVSISWPVTQN